MLAQSLEMTAETCGLSEPTVRRVCKNKAKTIWTVVSLREQGASFESPCKTR